MPPASSSELIVTMGIEPSSHARVRDTVGRWMRADTVGRQYTEMQIGLAAAEFTRVLRREFMAGVDKHGRSHNKTGETLRTLRIVVAGMLATITLGRGAVYVEYGWTRPEIRAKPGGVLSFVDFDGSRLFTKKVKPAFYRGDDFIGRAMGKVDLARMLDQIAYGTFSDMVGYALDRHGFQYTGGQMFRPIYMLGTRPPDAPLARAS